MRRDDEGARATEDARRGLANHIMAENPVRSFRFNNYVIDRQLTLVRDKDGPFATFERGEQASFYRTNNWAFQLTWTPGNIALTGDLGELTLSNHSCRDFDQAVGWAQSSDFSYLIGKSDKQEREFDQDGTVRQIVQMANEEPTNLLLGHTTYSNGWKRSGHGVLKDLRELRRLQHRIGPLTEDELAWVDNDMVGQDPYVFTRRKEPRVAGRWERKGRQLEWDYHDCWTLWARIWAETLDYRPLSDLAVPGFRRELADEMRGQCGTPESAADFCHKIGLDDYYGAYRWPWQRYVQIEAIRHGCRMIWASLHPEMQPVAAE